MVVTIIGDDGAAVDGGHCIRVHRESWPGSPDDFLDMEALCDHFESRFAARLWTFETWLRLRQALPGLPLQAIDETRAFLRARGTPHPAVPQFLGQCHPAIFDDPRGCILCARIRLSDEGWQAAAILSVAQIIGFEAGGMGADHDRTGPWRNVRQFLVDEIDREIHRRLHMLPEATTGLSRRSRL
ncbi:hypothetical protein KPL74_08910 [Bacillus sp. NP157]|nr:hypothetical protein KPL74_08910 [Bacillus sp. NP157]